MDSEDVFAEVLQEIDEACAAVQIAGSLSPAAHNAKAMSNVPELPCTNLRTVPAQSPHKSKMRLTPNTHKPDHVVILVLPDYEYLRCPRVRCGVDSVAIAPRQVENDNTSQRRNTLSSTHKKTQHSTILCADTI